MAEPNPKNFLDQTGSEQEYTLADFEYALPPELIAQSPLDKREASRLMVVEKQTGKISGHKFSDLVDLLRAGDLLVVNDTKVIPAKIAAKRASGGIIDILLLRAETSQPGLWQAMGTPIKRLKPGEILYVDGKDFDRNATFEIRVQDIIEVDGMKRLLLNMGSPDQVYRLMSGAGLAPLPPYIHRDKSNGGNRQPDLERYQTVFAKLKPSPCMSVRAHLNPYRLLCKNITSNPKPLVSAPARPPQSIKPCGKIGGLSVWAQPPAGL
jgi:S-adenosylmethionine:tRNA ribosyltransferase-isomerase